jgi:hypothetical protein
MNKQVSITPSLGGHLSGAISRGPSVHPRRVDSVLRLFAGFSFTCTVLALVIGCREIETDVAAAIDSTVLHRLSFIETSTNTSEKFKREVYLRDGAVESSRLSEVHFLGLKQSEAVVEVEIRSNGETTTKIIGYHAGCGCSRVELESKVIQPGQQVQVPSPDLSSHLLGDNSSFIRPTIIPQAQFNFLRVL